MTPGTNENTRVLETRNDGLYTHAANHLNKAYETHTGELQNQHAFETRSSFACAILTDFTFQRTIENVETVKNDIQAINLAAFRNVVLSR